MFVNMFSHSSHWFIHFWSHSDCAPIQLIVPLFIIKSPFPFPSLPFPPQEKGTQQTSSFCFSHFPVEVNMWKPLCCECVKTLRNRSLRPRRCKLFISLTRILETTRQTYPRTQTCHFTYWHTPTHLDLFKCPTSGYHIVVTAFHCLNDLR